MWWRLASTAILLLAGACSQEATSPAPLHTPAEIRLLESLSIAQLSAPGGPASNAVANDERAARLGHRLFFDPALSANGEVSCATCHQPERYFTDGRKTSRGLASATRNTPTVVGAAYAPFLFWDGRRDSLWAQALAPLETAAEMGSSRMEVVRYVTSDPHTAAEYAALFGEAPDFSEAAGFPPRASPYGHAERRAAWEALSEEARHAVDRAFANVGKAIAAYERRLLPDPSRFDAYLERVVAGDESGAASLLGPEERAGLRLFLDVGRTQCLRCHNGPLLTNHAFADVASGRMGEVPDLGRFLGVASVLRDPFNCLGRYSDASPEDCQELRFLDRRDAARATGAFKTPSLRGVRRTAPYFHDGSLATLEAVVDHYRKVDDSRGSEVSRLDLSDEEARRLVAFLRVFDGTAGGDESWSKPPPRPGF